MRKKKWIAKAIKRPGALRRRAKRAGLIRGDEPLSRADLDKLELRAKRTHDTRLLREVQLARRLKRMKK